MRWGTARARGQAQSPHEDAFRRVYGTRSPRLSYALLFGVFWTALGFMNPTITITAAPTSSYFGSFQSFLASGLGIIRCHSSQVVFSSVIFSLRIPRP